EARGGQVVEIRGDEALAVFGSAAQALRAAVELQLACAEELAEDPTLPLHAGAGLDIGDAARSPNGTYHGTPLNMAARLCAQAAAGEVLVTRRVADACEALDGVRFEPRGTFEPKGFEGPVEVIAATAAP